MEYFTGTFLSFIFIYLFFNDMAYLDIKSRNKEKNNRSCSQSSTQNAISIPAEAGLDLIVGICKEGNSIGL